ncbi:MAG TPA: LysR family transcriptional regulator [Clostridiales bacterium]|nr:LysR family transcriptional regulator [Clostridiales bacterium]
MQIEHIRLFYLAASLGSITKAARASHISQPALSQQIQRLEQELGFKLFERSNRGVDLTPAGQIVEKYAGNMVRLYDQLMDDLNNLRQSNGVVRIAATPVVGIYGLPCTIYKVKEKFPYHTFSLDSAPSVEVERRVLQGESDIGFINGPPNSSELVAKRVYSDRLVVVSSPQFPTKPNLDMEGLKNYPLIMLSSASSLRKQLEKYLETHHQSLDQYKVLFHLDSAESVKSSVLRGHGIAFLPYMSIKKELYQKQLKQIDVSDFNMSYDVYSIYKRQENKSDMLYRICVYFSKIVAETFC